MGGWFGTVRRRVRKMKRVTDRKDKVIVRKYDSIVRVVSEAKQEFGSLEDG